MSRGGGRLKGLDRWIGGSIGVRSSAIAAGRGSHRGGGRVPTANGFFSHAMASKKAEPCTVIGPYSTRGTQKKKHRETQKKKTGKPR